MTDRWITRRWLATATFGIAACFSCYFATPADAQRDEDDEETLRIPQAAVELDVKGLRLLSPTDEVWIDEKEKTVVVGGRVVLNKGPLEMLACPRNTKEHESVVAIHAKSFVVHTGLLAIGAKPGHPVRLGADYRPASGDRIHVEAHWQDVDGDWTSCDAKSWVQDSQSKRALDVDWVFAGSKFWTSPETNESFYHAEGGELICVANFSTAMMDLPIQSHELNSQRLFNAYTDNIPSVGTRVKLVLSVQPDEIVESTVSEMAQTNTKQGAQGKVVWNPGKSVANKFNARIDRKSELVPYLLFTPRNYSEASFQWPTILFLHGFGESGLGGPDLIKVKRLGPPAIVEQDPDFPFVVIAPQCPNPGNDQTAIHNAWSADSIVQMLDYVAQNLAIDPDRIYLTGLSMGGYGAWRTAANYPDRFAALAPVCGGGKLDYAKRLPSMPIWCFHGKLDDVVPVSESVSMIDAIRAVGGKPKLTIYPDIAHDSWGRAYDEPLFEWFLAQRRQAE